MNTNPLVTVIVPAYNHEKYVVECLESIHNQTYRNFQWIVVDDGSKDNTLHILQQYQNIMHYELLAQSNKGLSSTLTDVIKNKAKGKYIAICASDDFWVPTKLEKQIQYMEEHPEVAFCYSDTFYVDESSQLINNYNSNVSYRSGYVFEDIICQNFHPPVNYLIKKTVLEEVGYYPKGIIAEDFFMNCAIASKYPIGYINKPLSYYRVIEFSKKRDPLALILCHRHTIDLYKDFNVYQLAVKRFNLRSALWLAKYKKYKGLSIKYLVLSLWAINKKDFYRCIYNLFTKWY